MHYFISVTLLAMAIVGGAMWGDSDTQAADPFEIIGYGEARCYIVGEVSWAKEDMEPSVRLRTDCPIHIVRDGQYVKMSSAKWAVEIVIPEIPRPQGFLYVWGQQIATIGNRSIIVRFGPTDGV
jgi:hypothetical protein